MLSLYAAPVSCNEAVIASMKLAENESSPDSIYVL